jgi:hypothetical protein
MLIKMGINGKIEITFENELMFIWFVLSGIILRLNVKSIELMF